MKIPVKLLILSFALLSCSTGRLTPTTQILESETVIIGIVKVLNRGNDITKNARIYYDENSKGTYSYLLESNGYFYMKIPKGKHFIKTIAVAEGLVNLPRDYAKINVEDNNKVYYIGNIKIDVDRQLKYAMGAIPAMIAMKSEGVRLPITLTDNDKEIKDFYLKTFGTSKEIVNSIIDVNKE